MTRSIRDEDDDGSEVHAVEGAKALRKFTSKNGNECLVVLVDGDETVVPQSAIHDNSEVSAPGDEGRLVVQYWLARDRGWV